MRLTVRNSVGLKLPTGKSDHIAWDDEIPGFGIRVREGGSKTFVFQYKVGAKQRRLNLGSLTAVDIGKARKTAENLYARVKLGHDPAGEKADTKAKAHKTFGALVGDFLNHKRETLRPRSYPNVERHLLVYAKTLHELQIDKIKLADIATVIGVVEKNAGARKRKRQGNSNGAGAVSRNCCRASLSTFFAWAVAEGYVTSNPVIGTRRAGEKSRDRVLSPAELRIIWKALPDNDYGAILKLLALTGQRAAEIAGLRWSEVDLDKALISLPGERTKNGRPHGIPLSPAARSIISTLEKQPRRTTTNGELRDLIFGAGKGPFSGWSKAKTELDAAIKKAAGKALPHWQPHDLRRTVATSMAQLGISLPVIEKVLNHTSGSFAGVVGVYQHHEFADEKRAALVRWADQLMAWVEGRETNVTQLRRA